MAILEILIQNYPEYILQSCIRSDGNRVAPADRNVVIAEGRAMQATDESAHTGRRRFLGKKSEHSQTRTFRDDAVCISIEGREMIVRADNNLPVCGIDVVSDGLFYIYIAP